mmetsp:Transcript_1431/g.1961  ORF Transcript_1431/g.1961 Transcript_1431/m.1961 type:complete len:87 (+) Transcript_1431:52-312(+)
MSSRKLLVSFHKKEGAEKYLCTLLFSLSPQVSSVESLIAVLCLLILLQKLSTKTNLSTSRGKSILQNSIDTEKNYSTHSKKKSASF